MTNNQFPVILERFVQSYPKQSRFAYELMPLYEAEVARDAYKILRINEDHLEIGNFKRAYGTEAQRMNSTAKDSVIVNMNRYTVESAVDRAELVGSPNAVQSSLLIREARLRNAYDKMMNSLESEQIDSILDASLYGTHTASPSGEDLWSANSSDPISQIETARNTIKLATGLYPNKCIISDSVWQRLRFKKNLVDKLPYTTLRSGITPEDFARIISVDKVVIADNMYKSEGQLSFSWGNNVVLAYVPQSIYTLETLTFGVTVRAPLGYAEMRDYYDEKTTSDVVAVDERLGWVVANYEAGFLFQNVL